jgi:hypothetical protein
VRSEGGERVGRIINGPLGPTFAYEAHNGSLPLPSVGTREIVLERSPPPAPTYPRNGRTSTARTASPRQLPEPILIQCWFLD